MPSIQDIELTDEHKGQWVIYQAGHPGAKPEDGNIIGWSDSTIFVQFWKEGPGAKGCSPEDLRWPGNLIREVVNNG